MPSLTENMPEFMPEDIANGFINLIQQWNAPTKYKLWLIENVKNFNQLSYEQRSLIFNDFLKKFVEQL